MKRRQGSTRTVLAAFTMDEVAAAVFAMYPERVVGATGTLVWHFDEGGTVTLYRKAPGFNPPAEQGELP